MFTNKIKYCFLIFLVSLLLASCQKKLTYTYLIGHPEILKKELKECDIANLFLSQNKISSKIREKNNEKNQEKIKYCQMLLFTAKDMLFLLNQQQEDPEKFGEELLRLQMSFNETKMLLDETENEMLLDESKTSLDESEKKLQMIQKQNVPAIETSKEKSKRDELKKLYKKQNLKIETMLAVIGINKPT